MPDVIDLISSTPPAPAEKPAPTSRAPATAAALVSSPPPFSANTTTNTRATRPPPPPFTFSDDIDIFSSPFANARDTIDNNPSKRRRLSDEDFNLPPSGQPRSRSRSPNRNLNTNARKSNPFEFSDELWISSSVGPTIRSKSPNLNTSKNTNPFQFSDELGIPSSTGRKSPSKSPNPRAKSNPFQFSDELGIPSSTGPTSRTRAKSPNLNTRDSNPFKFSDDFDEFGLPPAPTPGLSVSPVITRGGERDKNEGLGTGSRWAVDSDPIVFTSSAGKPQGNGVVGSVQSENTITIDSNDDNGHDIGKSKDKGKGRERGDEIEHFSDQLFSRMSDMDELMEIAERPKSTAPFSNRTASLLASLEDKTGSASAGTKKTTARSRKGKTTAVEEQVDVDVDVEPPQPKRKTTTKPITQDKEAKVRSREANKAAREREREAEKERKAKAKEEKAKEKQLAADLAQVNKSKVDKKESTPEMIVDFDKSLEGSSVGNQAVEFMNRLGVEYTFFEGSIRGLVKWRRKVQATYNESLGYWEPCPLRIESEKHVLCLLTAQEFVDMVTAPETSPSTLQNHVLILKQTHPDTKPIYLLEGLTAFMRKNQNARNRAYQAEVRRQLDPSTTTTSSSSRRKNQPELPQVSDDSIEDALLHLQIHHGALIHHTSAAAESAEWLKTFTEHISTIPYRLELMQGNDSAFCMDVGQVKTGDDKRDTFVKMLQEVNRVTASMAYGVVERYPSVGDLVGGFKNGGVGLLEDVKKSANKNGALTDSRIGPAVSRRLYKVFMGLDPASTEI
ncbi:hypothetical protein SI65_08952 [Aspergillus cristatus]|uniref:ERCC4 domain-containing protein n=1 Tax=Aspergillus cristatus TaxID=573508 RepID=A0A1E3B4A2_ASPCR|nr:hypothetical protein SI65_08952 [Aspergillus cristatus]